MVQWRTRVHDRAISERELATMPLSPWTPEYQSHTRERIEKAIADDRERWGLTPL